MRDTSLRDVVYFTLAWGMFAGAMLAAQPGPMMQGMPHFVKPAEAAAATPGPQAKPLRISLAASLENAE